MHRVVQNLVETVVGHVDEVVVQVEEVVSVRLCSKPGYQRKDKQINCRRLPGKSLIIEI